MKCPTCGAPVIKYKDGWECGYCGDSGRFYYTDNNSRNEPDGDGCLFLICCGLGILILSFFGLIGC